MHQRNRIKLTISRILPILFFAVWIAALATAVAASSPGEKDESSRQASESASTESAEPSVAAREGMKVVVDPETGEIISVPIRQQTGTLSAPLAKALTRSAEDLHFFDLPTGGKGVDLDGRYQHVVAVRVKPDGSFETVCVNHSHEAEGFLKRKSAETGPQSRDK